MGLSQRWLLGPALGSAPGTWGDLDPSCFLGAVKVCGEEFKPAADRLGFCLWVL